MRDFPEGPNGLGWRFHQSYMDREMAYKEKSRLTSTRFSNYHYPGRGLGRDAPVVTMLGYPKKMICPNPPPNSFRAGYATKSSDKLMAMTPETSLQETYASLFGSGEEVNLWEDHDVFGSNAVPKQKPQTPVPSVAVRKPLQAKLSRTAAVTNFQSSKAIASGVAEIMKCSAIPAVSGRSVFVKQREILKRSASMTAAPASKPAWIPGFRQQEGVTFTIGTQSDNAVLPSQTVKSGRPVPSRSITSRVLPSTNVEAAGLPKGQASARTIYPQLRRRDFPKF